MQATNVIAVLKMLGGTVRDLKKVWLIEQIYLELSQRKEEKE